MSESIDPYVHEYAKNADGSEPESPEPYPTTGELEAVRARLCGKPVESKVRDPNDFPGTCIRPKDHLGRCKKISNGMTAAEALRISEVE